MPWMVLTEVLATYLYTALSRESCFGMMASGSLLLTELPAYAAVLATSLTRSISREISPSTCTVCGNAVGRGPWGLT